MDKYEELIAVFSETLEQSRDYHIAYMYQVGYVSVLGLYERDSTQNNSMKIDEVFHSPEEMADSLLRNWRWQWFYKNRKLLVWGAGSGSHISKMRSIRQNPYVFRRS